MSHSQPLEPVSKPPQSPFGKGGDSLPPPSRKPVLSGVEGGERGGWRPPSYNDAPPETGSLRRPLEDVFHRLLNRYGPQAWWPGDGPFEVMVGAILTQATSWNNVEKAIANLKEASALTPARLRQVPEAELVGLIRPCLYYNVKARKLKALVHRLETYGDSLPSLFSLGVAELHRELLSIYGVGDETADSIILYAAHKPVFVIDAYTRRILERLGLARRKESYGQLQALFHDNLAPDVRLFNEYHALLVRLGKEVCRPKPRCALCPLKDICPTGGG